MTVIMKSNAIWLLSSLIREGRKKKIKEERRKEKEYERRERKKRHKESWHKRDDFLHFSRNRGNSKKAVCVVNKNTAFGYYLNKV